MFSGFFVLWQRRNYSELQCVSGCFSRGVSPHIDPHGVAQKLRNMLARLWFTAYFSVLLCVWGCGNVWGSCRCSRVEQTVGLTGSPHFGTLCESKYAAEMMRRGRVTRLFWLRRPPGEEHASS